MAKRRATAVQAARTVKARRMSVILHRTSQADTGGVRNV